MHAKYAPKGVAFAKRFPSAIGAHIETFFSAAKGRGRGWVTFSETWSKEQPKPNFVDFQRRSHQTFQDNHIFRKQYRGRWLNWWDPSSFLQMNHRRWNACLHLLSSFLLSGNRDILLRSGCFCTRYNSATCFASSYHFPFGSSGYSSKVASLFRSWTNVHGVSRLELPESCRNRALPPLGSFEEIGISFITPIARTRWGQVSGVKCCPSSPWLLSNPFIDLEHDIVRFGTRKYVEYELDLFSINFPSRFSVLLEIIIPSSGELDFWLVHRLFSHT